MWGLEWHGSPSLPYAGPSPSGHRAGDVADQRAAAFSRHALFERDASFAFLGATADTTRACPPPFSRDALSEDESSAAFGSDFLAAGRASNRRG